MTKMTRRQTEKVKKPLSAYNLFFREERRRILVLAMTSSNCSFSSTAIEKALEGGRNRPHRKSHGQVSFVDLVKMVSTRWKNIPPNEKIHYDLLAQREKERHREDHHEASKTKSRKDTTKNKPLTSCSMNASEPSICTIFSGLEPKKITASNVGSLSDAMGWDLGGPPSRSSKSLQKQEGLEQFKKRSLQEGLARLSSQLDDDSYNLLWTTFVEPAKPHEVISF